MERRKGHIPVYTESITKTQITCRRSMPYMQSHDTYTRGESNEKMLHVTRLLTNNHTTCKRPLLDLRLIYHLENRRSTASSAPLTSNRPEAHADKNKRGMFCSFLIIWS